jgi:hypothetical protein
LLALTQVQLKNRTSVDELLEQNDVLEEVQFIYARTTFLQQKSHEERRKVWRFFYDRSFDEIELNSLMSASRKALFCVEENQLNRSAKMLLAMEESFPSPSNAPIDKWQAAFENFAPFVLYVTGLYHSRFDYELGL